MEDETVAKAAEAAQQGHPEEQPGPVAGDGKPAKKFAFRKKIAKPQIPKEPPKQVLTTGKRKRAIARAVVRPGKGNVKVNKRPIAFYPNPLFRLRMQEPLLIAGDAAKGFDITVTVRGGGLTGQSEAARMAIARGLAEYVPDLKQRFLSYDRNLLVYDARRTEPHKPPRSSQGPRRHKQRSKR